MDCSAATDEKVSDCFHEGPILSLGFNFQRHKSDWWLTHFSAAARAAVLPIEIGCRLSSSTDRG